MIEDGHNTNIVNTINIDNIIADDIFDEESINSNTNAIYHVEDINDTMIYNNEIDYDMDSFERLKIG
jgi:hypothetical protein